MRRIWIPRTGAPEVLEVREEPDPVPGPGEVRIAVAAAGVNFADVMARMGLYQDAPPLPAVVGYEVSGTIDAVGPGVDEARIGESVVALTRFGGYASAVCVPEVQVARRPDGLDAVTAAAVPVAGLTAYMLVDVMGRVRPGDRVLVHSAGGSVGLFALDLIHRAGGYAVGTASARKHERLYARGWDELVDYTAVDYEAALKDGPGFDLVLDPVGGASWGKGLRLLRAGGRLGAYGMSSSAKGKVGSKLAFLRAALSIPWLASSPPALINENKGLFGVNMGHLWHEGERVRGWMTEVVDLVGRGTLKVDVHATFPFDRAAEAHHLIHRRENVGKVLLTP